MTQPIITIKGVKFSAFASHETACFQATVYRDGKRWCTAHNGGFGGPTDFDPLPKQTNSQLYKEIAEYDRGAPSKRVDIGLKDGELFEAKCDLEHIVMGLLDTHLTLKDMRRALKSRIVGQEDGQLMEWATKPTPEAIERIRKRFPDVIILNSFIESEALALWRAA